MFHFDIGIHTLSTYDDDGFISHQYDAEGEASAGVAEYEGHHFLGFIARPLDPVVDGTGQPDAANAGQILIAMEGGKGHAFPLEDPRAVPNLPALKPGESAQYGCAGNFTRMKADGSIVSFTTDAGGASSGNSIYCTVGGTASDGSLEFNRIAPWGTEHFGQNGYDLLLKSGARIRGGALGGLPDPLSGVDSYWKISAALVRIIGSAVAIGPAGAEAEPAAKSTTLLVYLAAIVDALIAIAAVPAVVGTAPAVDPGVIAALLALATPPPIQSSVTVG